MRGRATSVREDLVVEQLFTFDESALIGGESTAIRISSPLKFLSLLSRSRPDGHWTNHHASHPDLDADGIWLDVFSLRYVVTLSLLSLHNVEVIHTPTLQQYPCMQAPSRA